MSHARITDLLRQTMGLEAESIGVACVERAVSKRLAARGLRELQSYWELLRTSAEELQQLIEAIVIPETWFFRDSEAFAAMVRVVRAEWLAKHPAGTLRLLSLPCSTGEEPFSIAMALLDGGLAPSRFHIDAIDISVRAIACAERAIYGKNSFRAKDLGFRDRYFEPVERGYRLSDLVRRQVSFRHGNLLSADGRQGADAYEVIFCRNVLIYFDRVSQHRAIEVLGRLLTSAGLLFVGPSETGLLLDRGFVPAGIPLAFAFRRAGGAAAPVVAAKPVAAKPIPEKPRQPASAPKSTPEPIPPDAIVAAAEPWIAQARRLADQGKLVEALACCEQNLRAEAASAETFHLVGLLHDAAGRVHDAAEHYRKALYLDPRHPEALIHLAVALQKAGDARGAQRLFERANRQATPIASKRGG